MTHIEEVGERLAQHEGSIAAMERELKRQRFDLRALKDKLGEGETMASGGRGKDPAEKFQDKVRDNVRALIAAGGSPPAPETRLITPKSGQLPAGASRGDELPVPDLPWHIDQILVDGVDAPIKEHEGEQVSFQIPEEASSGEVAVAVYAGGRWFAFRLTLDVGADGKR